MRADLIWVMPQGWFSARMTGAGFVWAQVCNSTLPPQLQCFTGEWLTATATKQKQRIMFNSSKRASQRLQRQPSPPRQRSLSADIRSVESTEPLGSKGPDRALTGWFKEVCWWLLHLKEPGYGLRHSMLVWSLPLSACEDTCTQFMSVNHGLDAVESYTTSGRKRLARFASGLQWNAGSHHGSGLQSVSLWDMHAELLLWFCEYAQQVARVNRPGPRQIVPVS